MAIEDDDKPRKKITHEIGQDLSLLSVEELTERIALMNSEIERLQQAADEEARVQGCGEQFFQDVDLWPVSRSRTSSAQRREPGPIRRGPSLRQATGRLSLNHHRRWLWVPAFAGTTRESIPKLGQWPTWQIIPEENRSFTID